MMNFKDALIAHLQGEVVEVRGAEMNVPWKSFAKHHANVTIDQFEDPDFAGACEYRIKPRTVLCNGVEVPAPESVAPAEGSCYYTPHVTREPGYNEETWDEASFDLRVLEQGLVYLNKEDAIARAKAMLITNVAS